MIKLKNIRDFIILIIIVLVIIISYEYINRSIKFKEETKVNIKAFMIKKEPLTYQITLIFDTQMKPSYSYLSSFKSVEHFWNNEHEFRIVFKTEKEINSLTLTINPKGYHNFFITKDNKKLPTQEILVKLSKNK